MAEFTPEYKKQKLEAILEFHKDLMVQNAITRANFTKKMPFYDLRARYVVSLFPDEFKKDLYFELIDREHNPLEKERKVYRLLPNPDYATEYELYSNGSFLIPVEELREFHRYEIIGTARESVPEPSPQQPVQRVLFDDNAPLAESPQHAAYAGMNKRKPATAPVVLEDAPFAEMTIRDFTAIHTGKPISTKPWLNLLISNINQINQ